MKRTEKALRHFSFLTLIFTLTFALIISLSSCNNLFSSEDSEDDPSAKITEPTVIFQGIINLDSNLPQNFLSDSAQDSLARSASPQPFNITSTSTDYEYYVTASNGSETVTSEVDLTNHTFEIGLAIGTWNIETGIRTKNASHTVILYDTYTAILTAEMPIFQHDFFIKPAAGGTGSINLVMTVPTAVTKMGVKVRSQPAGAVLATTNTNSMSAGTSNIIHFERLSVASGIYDLLFTFYDSGDTPVFSTSQTVTVVKNLESTRWISGGTSALINDEAGSFELTEALINQWRLRRTEYYVNGDTATGNDSNTGGPLDPLLTVKHALSLINDIDYDFSDADFITKIHIARGTEEEVSASLNINSGKKVLIDSPGTTGTAPRLYRAASFHNDALLSVNTATLTLKDICIDGDNVTSSTCGVNNYHGTLIIQSGSIINHITNTGRSAGIQNMGTLILEGGEISNNKNTSTVTGNKGAGIYNNNGDYTSFTVSGGKVRNNWDTKGTSDTSDDIKSNVFIDSGSRIHVTQALAADTELGFTINWNPKRETHSDSTVFTTGYGYGTTNTTAPYTFFKSDADFGILPVTDAGTTQGEAAIALSGKNFKNLLKDLNITFSIDKNKFEAGLSGQTITITPQVTLKNINGTDADEELINSIKEQLNWSVSFASINEWLQGTSPATPTVLTIDHTKANSEGRYTLDVRAEFAGLFFDSEFTITGYKHIIEVNNANFAGITYTKQDCLVLTENLNLSGMTHTPFDIFDATFDGNGHMLQVNNISASHADYNTICRENRGIIQNLYIIAYNVQIDETVAASTTVHRRLGGICSDNYGTIRNCWADISTNSSTSNKLETASAPICINNYGTVENCLHTGSLSFVWAHENPWAGIWCTVGGIVANNAEGGKIRNCVNYDPISLETTYDDTYGVNGVAASICGRQSSRSAETSYCYWVRPGIYFSYKNTNCVFNPSSYVSNEIRAGTFEYNGTFGSTAETLGVNNKDKTHLYAGNSVTCPSSQTLITTARNSLDNPIPDYLLNEDDLDKSAVNIYVNDRDASHSYLKPWKAHANYAAVLNFD